MPDKNSESSGYQCQPDWRKKGLGWVPDYPDARDYNLNNNQLGEFTALKTNETTKNLENLTENILEVINFISSQERSISPEIDDFKKKIESKVTDKVIFKKVRIHKYLRLKDPKMESPEISKLKIFLCHYISQTIFPDDTFCFQKLDDLYKVNFEIDEFVDQYKSSLKEGYSTRLQDSRLKHYGEWLKYRKKTEDDGSKGLFEWMIDPTFDRNTDKIVALFQQLVFDDLREIDGIVGIKTYDKINDEYNLSKPKFKETQKSELKQKKDKDRMASCYLVSNHDLLTLKNSDVNCDGINQNNNKEICFWLKHSLCYLIYRDLVKGNYDALDSLYKAKFDPNEYRKKLPERLWKDNLRIYHINFETKFKGNDCSEQSNNQTLIEWLSEQSNNQTLIEWLDDPVFDEITYKRIVAIVQNIIFEKEEEVDGIVGRKTIRRILKKIYYVSYDIPNIFHSETGIFDHFLEGLNLLGKNELNSSEHEPQELIKKHHDDLLGLFNEVTPESFKKLKRYRFDDFQKVICKGKDLEEFCSRFRSEPLMSAIIGFVYPLVSCREQVLREGTIKSVIQEVFDNQNNSKYSYLKRCEYIVLRVTKLIDYDIYSWDKNFKKFLLFIQIFFEKFIANGERIDEWKDIEFFDQDYVIELNMESENDVDEQNQKYLKPIERSLPFDRQIFEELSLDQKLLLHLPSSIDLSWWCSPIRDQGSLNACTAFAATAMSEYFARRSKHPSTYTSLSPLFLYKAARNLMSVTEDTGSSVRETMRAMALFGNVPEKYWPYREDLYNEEPPQFCFSYGQSNQSLKYFRLDSFDISYDILLYEIKVVLTAGFPCIFGFTLYDSVYTEYNSKNGYIPFPVDIDSVVGGHVVLAVGYDDRMYVSIQEKEPGAILIRNSWGDQWGRGGYGWLPYQYVLKGLTSDWWSLIKSEWFESGNFGLGSHSPGDGQGPPKNGLE